MRTHTYVAAGARAAVVAVLCACAIVSVHGDGQQQLRPEFESQDWELGHVGKLDTPFYVKWYAPFYSGGGYCSEAQSFVLGLDKYIDRIAIENHGDSFDYHYISQMNRHVHRVTDKMHQRMHGSPPPSKSIYICHSEPGAWNPPRYRTPLCPENGALYKIGRTMFETDRLPKGWNKRLNKMDEVWVPTKFHRDIFVAGGVEPSKLVVVPEATDVEHFNPDTTEPFPLPGDPDDGTYCFLSVFKWEYRKGWDVLLKAYLTEFTREDNVILYILTASYHSTDDFMGTIRNFVRHKLPDVEWDDLPRMEIVTKLAGREVPQLYKAVDAFVLPSRGEGWGRPHTEAMSMALPVIATAWSGPSEYMTEENSYPLRHTGLSPIPSGPFKGHMMADPDPVHLAELMRHVFDNPVEAAERGLEARDHMVNNYHPDRLARFVVRHLQRISATLERRQEEGAHQEL